MTYRDKAKQKESVRKAVDKHRGITKEENVIPLPKAWQHLKEHISSPSRGMPNLERLQRVAGSLATLKIKPMFPGDELLRFGIHGIGFKEIGDVIGILPPKYGSFTR